MSKRELVDVDLHVLKETARALLVTSDPTDLADRVWLPKSECEVEDLHQHTYKRITMPEWLAVEKGLI